MAVNYTVSVANIDTNVRTASFGTGGTGLAFYSNGANSLIFNSGSSSTVRMYKFNPETVSGSITTTTATYGTTGSNSQWVEFYPNGSTSGLFIYERAQSIIGFYRRDIPNDTTTVLVGSRTATFATSSAATLNRNFAIHYNGTNSCLFAPGGTTTVDFYRFNADTVTGAQSTPTHSFTTSTSRFLVYYPNGANSCLFIGEGTQVRMYRFDPATPSTNTQVVFANSGNLTVNHISLIVEGSNAYMFATSGNTRVDVYRFNPSTVTGTVSASDANIAIGTNGALTCQAIRIGTEFGVLIGSNGVTTRFYKIAENATGSISSTNQVATISSSGTEFNVANAFVYDSTNGYLFIAFSGAGGLTTSFFKGITTRNLSIEINQTIFDPTDPIRKAKSGTLTIYSALDFFSASLYLRAGAQMYTPDYGSLAWAWAISATEDTELAINEDFAYNGASTEITGNYRLTLGASKTLTLASKGTYNDSWTIPGTGTLVITANTTLGSDFILSSGTTVNSSGGSYTLTIPYADPGLILGGGVTLSAPQPTITITTNPLAARVGIYRSSDNFEILNVNSNGTTGIATTSYSGSVPANVVVRVRLAGYKPYEAIQTITTSGLTLSVTLERDLTDNISD